MLPALPALAVLTAHWLAGDVRVRRVDAVLASGIITIALLVCGYMLREAYNDSWKSAKAVATDYRTRNTASWPLLFVGDRPYSASFYTGGKALRVTDFSELAQRLDQGGAFVALTKQQVSLLPPVLGTRLKLERQSGALDLYSSLQK